MKQQHAEPPDGGRSGGAAAAALALALGVALAGVLCLRFWATTLHPSVTQQLGALRQAMAALASCRATRSTASSALADPAAAPAAAARAGTVGASGSSCHDLPRLGAPLPQHEAVVPDASARREDVLPDVAAAVLAAERAGRGRKLVAMALFGGSTEYWPGVLDNAHLVAQHWPGWTLRVYHSDDAPECPLRWAAALGAELVRVARTSRAHEGAFWRYEALTDRSATRVVLRDVDGRMSLRDKAAVDEWVASGRFFHTLHDNPGHIASIMGGLFGTVNGLLHPRVVQRLLTLNATEVRAYGSDQGALHEVVWPLVKNHTLQHASFWCRKFGAAEWRGFPRPRSSPHDFVGNRYRPLNLFQGMAARACHKKCRRKPEWEQC